MRPLHKFFFIADCACGSKWTLLLPLNLPEHSLVQNLRLRDDTKKRLQYKHSLFILGAPFIFLAHVFEQQLTFLVPLSPLRAKLLEIKKELAQNEHCTGTFAPRGKSPKLEISRFI